MSASAKGAVARKQTPTPVATRVSDEATAIPAGFVGDDIERVYRQLQSAGKSEFETTDVYKKRLRQEAGASAYHFLAEPLDISYDADKQEMVMRLWVEVDPLHHRHL